MNLATNRWYAVVPSAEVPAGKPIARRRLGLDLVLWRDASGAVAAAPDRCPHRWAKLSPGRVVSGELECPFHGFRFNGQGGCTAIPAHPDQAPPRAMRLDALTLREEHGFVWAWTGPDAAPDAPVPFFDFGDHVWDGSAMTVPVANHYARAIENQLDFPHLPFVHRTTIGRFIESPAMDVVTDVDGDRIRAWLRGKDADLLDMIAPCIWRLRAGPGWQFLAFVPVDDEHMVYYSRSYQRVVTAPGLRWVFGKLNVLSNRFVINQDTPLVESQPPGDVDLQSGEVLVRSDGPIVAYRRWRAQHAAPWPATTPQARSA